jgi:hypothetical protein
MMQKHRISTSIGRDQKVVVELKNSFDLLEILSLKFTQKDAYSSLCSDYGVVVGRVSANNGLGIPNAKVSIFIPQDINDVDDPVINQLYPYTEFSDKNENGYRYNLLPSEKQHGGHVPTGTFPSQKDILTREDVLEVYEKYYTFTVKTNDAGDFMIWGVPVGTHILHIDVDLSDIGCFSLRPYDFVKKGIGEDNFDRFYNFKSSTDVDGLPQIVTLDKTIDVYPFWGNQNLCEIGITRTDFDLSTAGIEIEPVSLILMSSFTDDNNDAIKRNGKIKSRSGYKCNLQTSSGTIECVRYTGKKVIGSDGVTQYPELEYYKVKEAIDEDGGVMAMLPMNMDYVYTNEFGEQEVTKDSTKGVPTTTIARFRFSLLFEDPKIATAKYLVPNIREFNPDTITGVNIRDEYNMGMLATYQFSDVFEDYINVPKPITSFTFDNTTYTSEVKNHKKELMLGTKNNGIPEDYFYKFSYAKVYTVSSFQGTHYQSTFQIPFIPNLPPQQQTVVQAINAYLRSEAKDAFLGVKQIRPKEDEDCASNVNYFPTNFAFRNRRNFALILSQILLFIQFAFAIVLIKVGEILGSIFFDLASFIYNTPIVRNLFNGFAQRLENLSYNIQAKFTKILPLTIYPDCEECTQDDESISTDITYQNTYCRVAEVKLKVNNFTVGSENLVLLYVLDVTSVNNFSSSINPGTTLIPSLFPMESSKSNDSECQSVPTMQYSDLDNLHTYSVNVPNDPNTSKYYAQIYSDSIANSVKFSNFVGFFNDNNINDTDIKFNVDFGFGKMTEVGLGTGKYIEFTYQEWYNLTGIDYSSAIPVDDQYTYAVLRIYERGVLINTPSATSNGISIEQGCAKYDSVFDESIVRTYLWNSTTSYGEPTDPLNPPTYTGNFEESFTRPLNKTLIATIIGNDDASRLPYKKDFDDIGNVTYDRRTKSGLSEFRDGVFTIIPVIRGRSRNMQAIREWYNRKRVLLQFCGGVVNYSFIDNWLSGVLYFFKFENRLRWDDIQNYDLNQGASKYPRELIFYNVLDENFYYRSTPYKYQNGSGQFIGQQIFKINNIYQKQILHPTTFYDLGVRDEFFNEICVDPNIDATCSVVRDISVTSYQDPANIIEYALNYRLDINDAKLKVEDFFSGRQYGSNIETLDGDITQLISINCEAGIEKFDLDSPHYFMYNNEIMDPDDPYYGSYFKKNGLYSPVPIDLKFDENGAFVRGCLNYRLGDFSQKVPFYLWDKGNEGFGNYGGLSDTQKWDRQNIATMKLQRIFSVSSYNASTTNYLMADGEEEYLLKPMTILHPTFTLQGDYQNNMLERFEVISDQAPSNDATSFVEGDLWLHVLTFAGVNYRKDPISGDIYVVVNKTWVKQSQKFVNKQYENFVFETAKNYSGSKQVLSTPFLFYFGLKPGKTAFDKFTKYFGPKNGFTNVL